MRSSTPFPLRDPALRELGLRALLAIEVGAWLLSLLVFHPHGLDSKGLVARIPLLRLPGFVIGMVVGRAYLMGKPLRPAIREALVYSSIALSVAITQAFDVAANLTVVTVGLFGVLVFALAGSNGLLARLLRSHTMVQLGATSYAPYLFQFLVMNLFHLFYSARGIRSDGLAFAMPVTLLGVPLSVEVYRFVKERFRKGIRRRFECGPVPYEPMTSGLSIRKAAALRLAGRHQGLAGVGPVGTAVPSTPASIS